MSMFANWEEANRIQQQEAAKIKARKEADLEAQMDAAGFTDAEKARWKEGNKSDKHEDRWAYSKLKTRIEKVQREGVKAEPVALGPVSLREQTGSYDIKNPHNYAPTEIREQKPLYASGTGYEEYKTPEQLAVEQERLEQVIAEREILSERLREEKEIEEYQQRRREEDFDNLLRAGEFQVGDYEEVKAEYFETDRPSNLQPYVFDNLEYRENILGFDGINFDDFSDEEKIYSADVDGLITRQDVAYISGYESPANLEEAKERADSYYIQSLERNLENATTSEEKDALQELIDKGAPDFNTIEDIKNWESLASTFKNSDADGDFSVARAEYEALKLQADVVGEWASQPNQPDQQIILQMQNQAMSVYTSDVLPKDNYGNIIRPEDYGHVYLNTGTAYNQISSSLLEEENGIVGAVGQYTYIEPTFDKPSKLQKIAQPIGAVLSVLYPPLAPFIAAAATTIATDGDVQAGIEAGAETYVKGKVTDAATDKILDTYEALDIPVRELGQYTQSKIVDVTTDVIAGKSGTESAEDAAKSLLWKNIKDEAGYSFEEFDSKFDFSLPDFGLSGLDIDLPDIDLDLPDIDLPDLPDIDLPDVNLPDVNLPDVNLNLPDMPDLGVDLDLPDLDLDLSGIETPEFDFDLDLEGLDTEGLDIEMPEMPDVDVDLPSLNLRKQEREEKESEVEEMFLPELFRHDTQVKYTQGLLAPKINLRKFSK